MELAKLVGAGRKIGIATFPFLALGLVLNVLRPAWFSVGGPAVVLAIISAAFLVVGIVGWAWSVTLILRKVPRGELITSGPYSLVKHPLYASVSLLVLPWLGFMLDTWLGLAVGIIMYLAARTFAEEEETKLAESFGPKWDEYAKRVKLPWV